MIQHYSPLTFEQKKSSIVEALNHVLGNGCRLFRTARICGWNVQGEAADRAAELFSDQACEIWQAQDRIAARVRELGGLALPDDSDMVVVQRPSEIDYARCRPAQLAKLLADGQEASLTSLEAAGDVAEAAEDRQTLALIATRTDRHVAHLKRLLQLYATA